MAQEFAAKRIIFQKYVDAGAVPLDAFRQEELMLSEDDLQDGDILIKTLYLSLDPYMRHLMKSRPPLMHFISTSFELGKPLYGHGVARVVSSKHPTYQAGDAVVIWRSVEWATYSIVTEGLLDSGGCRKIREDGIPLSHYLGALGMPGLTAYAGLKNIAEPKAGEVAFVDAAAGAVGHVAGQLLKNVYNCRVVGSAGSQQKVELLKQLGFDAAFNYKEEEELAAMSKAMPTGIDIHWANVGGATLDHALELARHHGRIVLCGTMSDYEKGEHERHGLKNSLMVVIRVLRMQGLLAFELEQQMGDEFIEHMSRYIREGKVKPVEDVSVGIESLGQAFIDMMSGANVGKKIVAVDPNYQPPQLLHASFRRVSVS